MQPRDNTKDLIDLLGGNQVNAPDLPCGWGWYAQQSFDCGYLVTATGEGDGVRLTTKAEKEAKLFEADGSPKEVLIYDNGGETWDRYTALFTGPYIHETGGVSIYIGMSSNPTDPQGFGQHGEAGAVYVTAEDISDYDHWGKVIKFGDLPEACRSVVMNDYRDLWSVNDQEN